MVKTELKLGWGQCLLFDPMYLWSFYHTRPYSSRTKATNGVVYTCNIDNADNGSIFGAP